MVRHHDAVTRMLAATAMLAATGCIRTRATEVRVKDPGAVGVVANEGDRWLVPPHGPAQDVDVYSNAVTKDWLSRSASNDLHYVSRHWSLVTVVDDTELVDARGNVTGGAPGPVVQNIQHGDALRFPIVQVKSTGGFGCAEGSGCVSSPAVGMSLVTESRNVQEVTVVDKPPRGLGLLEMIVGAPMVGFGTIDGAINLANRPTSSRNTLLAVDAGLTVVGGALIANALWYLLAPEHRSVVYRADALSF